MSDIAAYAALAAAGFSFGLLNAISSRLQNTDTNGRAGSRYPAALLFTSVLIVSATYAIAMRLIASTSGTGTLVAYAVAQAGGCVLGVQVANSWLYRRFHRDAHGGRTTSTAAADIAEPATDVTPSGGRVSDPVARAEARLRRLSPIEYLDLIRRTGANRQQMLIELLEDAEAK